MKAENEWVNFLEIKEKVGMKDILEHYGLLKDLERKDDELFVESSIFGHQLQDYIG